MRRQSFFGVSGTSFSAVFSGAAAGVSSSAAGAAFSGVSAVITEPAAAVSAGRQASVQLSQQRRHRLRLLLGGFLCSLFGFALLTQLLCPGGGFLLPLFGAGLDAAHGAHTIHTARRNGLAAFLAQGLGAFVYTYRAKGGELAQLHAVDAMVGAGATHTSHSLHFHGVMTMRVWPSGRSSSFSAPARQAFSHLPQPKHLSVKLGR